MLLLINQEKYIQFCPRSPSNKHSELCLSKYLATQSFAMSSTTLCCEGHNSSPQQILLLRRMLKQQSVLLIPHSLLVGIKWLKNQFEENELFLTELNIILAYNTAVLLLEYSPSSRRNLHSYKSCVYSSFIYWSSTLEQPRYPLISKLMNYGTSVQLEYYSTIQ